MGIICKIKPSSDGKVGDKVATLGGIEIHVTTESPSYSVDVLTHPVEKGENIADHVKKNATAFSISGIVVGEDSEARLTKLTDAMNKGKGLFYNGVKKMSNVLIVSIDPDYSKDIKNGFAFSMKLTEYRVVSAKVKTSSTTATKKTTNQGTKQTTVKVSSSSKYVTVRKGDTLSKYAKLYNTTVAALKKLNPSVVPEKMAIGSKVRIK